MTFWLSLSTKLCACLWMLTIVVWTIWQTLVAAYHEESFAEPCVALFLQLLNHFPLRNVAFVSEDSLRPSRPLASGTINSCCRQTLCQNVCSSSEFVSPTFIFHLRALASG